MGVQFVIVLIGVAVIGLAALVAAGWFGQQQAEPVRDVYQPPLDEEQVRGDDLEQVRFGITPMGYDMAQVDEWMARMARELDRRDGKVRPAPDGSPPEGSASADPAGSLSATTDDAE